MKKRQLLLVEDDPIMTMVESALLKKHGYDVTTSNSGEKAIELIKNGADTDLVLMDIDLETGMDGCETARELLNIVDLPIIFLTSHQEKETVEKVKGITQYGYVLKDSGEFVLISSIETAFLLFEAHKKTKESEEKYRKLFNDMLNGYAYCKMIFDENQKPVDFIYLDINHSFENITGMRRETVIGRKVTEVIPDISKEHPEIFEIYGRVAATGEPAQFEINFLPIKISLNIKVHCPQKGYFVSIFENITEKKRAEEALRDRETFLSGIINNIPDAYIRTNIDGFIIMVSPSASKIYGYSSPEEMIGINAGKLYKNLKDRENLFNCLSEHGRITDLTGEGLKKDGSSFWVSMNAQFIYDDNGNIQGTEGFIRDITKRIHAEEALIESDAELKLALDAANAGAWEWNLKTNDNKWSDDLWRLYGLSPYSVKPSYESWRMTVNEDDIKRIEPEVIQAVHEAKELNIEWRVRNGERWLMSRGRPIFDSSGNVVKYIGIVIDITTRKQMEEQIKSSLKENEILLREVHHRVKNNMSVISSLLGLNEILEDDPKISSVFKESKNRIKTMMHLHEKLSRSNDLMHLDFGIYLDEIMSDIIKSYGRSGITYSINTHGLHLDLENAIPCALIVNELASNSLKYAFPDGKKGHIEIKFRKENENMIVFSVSDNGIGVPSDFNINDAKTIGLQLVSTLSEQLRSTVRFSSENGTNFTFSFKMA